MEDENKITASNSGESLPDAGVTRAGDATGEENITSLITETQNPEADMEVHQHSHDSHGKKSWKNYFWEFLMLFLAVFCGFLAEYQLEHKIEQDREKQFITSLVVDLQDDTKNLEVMIISEYAGIEMLDTLMNILNDTELAKQQGDQLYYTARVGPRSQPFANNSRTFDQLKHSGGFRLIRKAAASNKIMEYYNLFAHIRLMEDNFNHEFDNYKRVAAKILDPGILRKQEAANGEIQLGNYNPSLMTYDRVMLKELGFHTLQMAGSRRSKILMLENLKKSATLLMSHLKEQYHIN
ncbi:MAG: hypothetical protein H7Y86_19160 [Rhizobacter sp.]|nr:hypothetical protein [Ferruginibacter sp.]